ncbi:hypothetical protein ElyMa_000846000 [Elysia marginata]|uniref:Uncharacterized protein n=1 Tax=Elysia marginata TaxID=1093978 RepID=A0AAV4H1K5_9GAST|nr:hypothetical protein ElyMa_000846000 [Elysia marginata]
MVDASHSSLPRNPFIAEEEEFMVDEEDGAELSPNLATFLTKRFATLTADKKLKSKLELYKRPANCKVLTAPLTNKDIWRTLKTPAKRTDVKLTNVQKNMAKATIAMVKCADELALRADYKDKLTSLTDAMTVLGHTHKSITNLRRELMHYALPYDFKSHCDATTEASNTLLYGDDIKQNLKDAKEQRRLTASLQVQRDNKYRRPSLTSGPFLVRGGRGRANLSARPFAPRYKMPKQH